MDELLHEVWNAMARRGFLPGRRSERDRRIRKNMNRERPELVLLALHQAQRVEQVSTRFFYSCHHGRNVLTNEWDP
eukprot:4279685-Pyramimonas_sp.AAC.1